ncbi:MAG: hypothetical protein JXB49_29630 [Bacteroidales bacterium]|nr:hypothetical protein [Bacteroidales bacterium]
MNTNEIKHDDRRVSENTLLNAMADSDKYSHLRIILSRKAIKGTFPHCFLMVTPSSFGIVKLLELGYDDDKIILHLQDVYTEITSKVYLDIHDKRYKFLLIEWQDILDMVLRYKSTLEGTEEMLELDENEVHLKV